MSFSATMAKSSNVWKDINWFALQTRPRRENFAATNVRTLGIESFLPQLKAEGLIDGVAQTKIKPLFPGYFFARFRPEDSLELVERSRGILQVVSSGRFPIPVEDEVVRDIQNCAGEDGLIRIRERYFKSGDRISIRGGPFEGMIGRVERELNDGKRVAILLEALWHSRVVIERHWLDAADA
jgi:transcriptional antiterminator RfaH